LLAVLSGNLLVSYNSTAFSIDIFVSSVLYITQHNNIDVDVLACLLYDRVAQMRFGCFDLVDVSLPGRNIRRTVECVEK